MEEKSYLISNYNIIKFDKSKNKLFKYTATLKDIKESKKVFTLHFGNCKRNGDPYEQYKDRTGLNLYSHCNNYNPIKSLAWYRKNKCLFNEREYSSKYLEWVFLQKSI